MKATEAKLLDFLKKFPQFVIPIYHKFRFMQPVIGPRELSRYLA